MKRFLSLVLSLVLTFALLTELTGNAAAKLELKTENKESGIKLSWNNYKSFKKCKILRKTAGKKKYKTLKTLSKKCSFIDKTAKYGKQYYYKIKYGKATSAAKKVTRLKAPKITRIINSYKNGLYISWNSIKGASKYKVYSGTKLISTVKENYISNYNPGFKNSVKYKVRAVKGSSKSDFSKAVSWAYDENIPKDSAIKTAQGAIPQGTQKIDFKEDRNISDYDLSEYCIFGYHDAANTTMIFNSWNEYKSFFKKTFAEYDKEFFKTKSLIFLYRHENNYSTKHKIGSMSYKNNILYLTDITLTRADSVIEPAIGNWNIFATVKKSDVKDVKQIVISKDNKTY